LYSLCRRGSRGGPVISVILCGGAGSRLWPLSRELHPKPFLTLPSGRSLLEETYLHAAAEVRRMK
jgi:mannose-1-phosphate guanylyltransferase